MTVANLPAQCCLFVSQDLQFIRSKEPLHPITGRPFLGEFFSVCFAVDRSTEGQSGPGRSVTLLTAPLWRDIITQMDRIQGLVLSKSKEAPTPERWATLMERFHRLADAVDEVEEEEDELPA